MVALLSVRPGEGFTSLDAEVASPLVTDRLQPGDRLVHLAVRRDDDDHVDHVLSRKSRHRCRADMLDRDCDIAERGLSAVAEADELRRPRRVVLDDHDGITHTFTQCGRPTRGPNARASREGEGVTTAPMTGRRPLGGSCRE